MEVEKLILQSNNFLEQFHFYVETLELELLEKNKNFFSVKAGKSRLVFQKSATRCYYHFAFNVPPFQITEALDWTQKRIEILEYEGAPVIDFPTWNAKAFYFFDADKNIVELIDRRNLNIKTELPFSTKNLLEISEIGLPVNDIQQTFDSLNKQISIDKYSGDLKTFCAAGDEHGLFIIVNKNEKNWLPTELPAKAFPFKLYFKMDDEQYLLNYSGEEISLKKRL